MPIDAPDPAAVVTACEDGPLLVRGDFAIRAQDGTPIDARRGTVALCRCGRSAIRPFCDGTHKLIGFKAPSGREGPDFKAPSGREGPDFKAPSGREGA